jgi:hypothetical protein
MARATRNGPGREEEDARRSNGGQTGLCPVAVRARLPTPPRGRCGKSGFARTFRGSGTRTRGRTVRWSATGFAPRSESSDGRGGPTEPGYGTAPGCGRSSARGDRTTAESAGAVCECGRSARTGKRSTESASAPTPIGGGGVLTGRPDFGETGRRDRCVRGARRRRAGTRRGGGRQILRIRDPGPMKSGLCCGSGFRGRWCGFPGFARPGPSVRGTRCGRAPCGFAFPDPAPSGRSPDRCGSFAARAWRGRGSEESAPVRSASGPVRCVRCGCGHRDRCCGRAQRHRSDRCAPGSRGRPVVLGLPDARRCGWRPTVSRSAPCAPPLTGCCGRCVPAPCCGPLS